MSKQFTMSFDDYANDFIPQFVGDLKKKVAKELFIAIVNNKGSEQPFLTGSYISSHRIGIGAPDETDVVYKLEGTITAEQAKHNAERTQLPKLEKVLPEEDIWISNSVGWSNPNHYSWARNVEYSGWPGGRGPYLIYERAIQEVVPNINKWAEEIADDFMRL